ncbi:type I restriction endonuclease subunit R [Salinarimonas sp.]|uniref:type I restriction endonuclease subunit R n=1 Tax=Salinarimonas sp. TaxID=2766526 RepID=UPI0032D9256C
MPFLSEADIERLCLERFAALGYHCARDSEIGPDGKAPAREAYSDVILAGRLDEAIARLNPHMPEEARADALKAVLAQVSPALVEENRRLHRAMVEGVRVEYYDVDGTIRGDFARLIDFDDPGGNDWLALSQMTVVEGTRSRRPDVVVFVNGLPLGVVELKNPGSEAATLSGAYNQIQTYKAEIPSLFRANAVLVTSDGLQARLGSLTADEERFMPWRTTDGASIAPKGAPELDVLLEGVFEKARLLELIRFFTVFGDTGAGLVKIIAGYHQVHAVKRAVAATLRAMPAPPAGGPREYGPGLREDPAAYGLPDAKEHPRGDKRVGVIWHTQGSGKSLLMAFYAGRLIDSPALANPTLVVVTDRHDLDDQLFGTFAMCRDLIRQTPVQADSRRRLRELLSRDAGGVIFTTMQKFRPGEDEDVLPELTDRRNVVVIADEAHRTQYGFKARVSRETGEIAYGLAKHLRDALPNASFIGFTGTPIETDDVNTPAVFGDYIDIYDISRAVEDGATVPIYYESRLARIELPAEERPRIDEEIAELTEDEALSAAEKLKQKWSTVEALVGSRKRLSMVAEDLVRHFEDRLAAMDGKGMVVCMSRRICVTLYDEIVRLRPEWHDDDDAAGAIKIVMTGAASDPEAYRPHIGGKARRDLLAKRAKDPEDPLKLVIVRDMWLTGFDAPSMHTMYIDKPMRGHGLMQAIARVNRVFRNKPAGLVVDYIGVAQNLKAALGQYSDTDRRQAGIDEAEAVAVMLEKFEIVAAMFHGFDYETGLCGTPQERLATVAAAIDFILARQHEAAEKETTDEAKKAAHRRFQDAVLALTKAYALAAASDAAREIRDAVGFFQTVRAALAKSSDGGGRSAAQRELAVRQIIDRAVASTEIVDILKAAGLKTPDISILSDEFLAEVQAMEKKNLALEALRRLIDDEIRSRTRTNVVETKRFSERLDAAIARYHTNALSTVEVLQALIDLAKDISDAKRRGEAEGFSAEEIAFYDALAENESAVDVMGNDHLKVIAHELLEGLKNGVSVDWAHRDSARAKMRVLVKRILRKHGYPPDLQDAAVQTVLRQAEALSAAWVG